MRDTNLVNALRKHAEWAKGNQWETPITLGDDLAEAADRIEAQAKEIEKLRRRLKAYEDTGLTPEKIDMDHEAAETLRQLCRGYDLGRLVNLTEADKDGRLAVHGRWISWEEAGNCVPSPDRHECSVCHDAAQVLVNGFELLSDYCPNCGAKMDGGDNTER